MAGMETPEFDTGPVAGLQTPIRMRDPRFLQLTTQEKLVIAQWYGSPAYLVWQKLSEGELEKLETAHFQNWKEEETFQRTGLFAVAARAYFEKIQLECQRQVEEFSGELDFIKQQKELLQTSPEDQVKNEFK
jgi:hypothetical protein